MKKMFLLAISLLLISCTNDLGMRELLEKEGYKDIKPTGYKLLSCSDDDFYHTGFSATKEGKIVTGTVCEGLFKGKTIRYD